MKLIVNIQRNGVAFDSSLVPDAAQALFCTQKAGREIYKRMREIGALCSRCGIVARSAELVDGKCAVGVACNVDVDSAILNVDDGAEKTARHQATIGDIWRAFINCLPKSLDDTSPPSQSEESSSW